MVLIGSVPNLVYFLKKRDFHLKSELVKLGKTVVLETSAI